MIFKVIVINGACVAGAKWAGPGKELPSFLPPLLTPSTKANINQDIVMSNQVCFSLQNPGTKKKIQLQLKTKLRLAQPNRKS